MQSSFLHVQFNYLLSTQCLLITKRAWLFLKIPSFLPFFHLVIATFRLTARDTTQPNLIL